MRVTIEFDVKGNQRYTLVDIDPAYTPEQIVKMLNDRTAGLWERTSDDTWVCLMDGKRRGKRIATVWQNDPNTVFSNYRVFRVE